MFDAGGGLAFGAVLPSAESTGAFVDSETRLPLTPFAELEALWLGQSLFAGAFARAGYALDFRQKDSGAAISLGARVGWSY